MPPDLSEKNFEGTIEQVLIQAIPALGIFDRKAGQGGSLWRLIHGVDGLVERFSHGWLANYTNPKRKRGDQARDLAYASG